MSQTNLGVASTSKSSKKLQTFYKEKEKSSTRYKSVISYIGKSNVNIFIHTMSADIRKQSK